MQQLFVQLEKLCLQPNHEQVIITRQIDLLISKIERFVLVQHDEFELWLITSERPDELLAKLLTYISDSCQQAGPSTRISPQFIVKIIPYFTNGNLKTLHIFLASLKNLTGRIARGDLIPTPSIEIIFQQMTTNANLSSMDIIAALETMHSITDITESNWSSIGPYFQFLIEQAIHLSSPEELAKLFDLVIMLCQSKSGLLNTFPINLFNKRLSIIDNRHTQELINFIEKTTVLTQLIPTKLKISTIEEICEVILLDTNLESQELLNVLVRLAHLCESRMFTENLPHKYPKEMIQQILLKQTSQLNWLKTLVLITHFLNYYQQQMDIHSQFLNLAQQVITQINEDTLLNLNPQQKQSLRNQLAAHHSLAILIDNMMIPKTPTDIIKVIVSGDVLLFKAMLQEMTEEDIISLFYSPQQILNTLLDYRYFPMYLEQLLKNCYIDTCIQLLIDGKLDYFYLNFSQQSLNFITQVFFNLYLHQDINVVNQLFKLLHVRKKSTKDADDRKLCLELQLKILNVALESYQKNKINLKYLTAIHQQIQALSSESDDIQNSSLKKMHAYQQAEFAAHHLMDSNGEPNLTAFYVETDVQSLLSTRLSPNPNIGVLAALDPNFSDFKELLEQGIKNHQAYESIVIPMHIGHHWVGISIQTSSSSQPLVIFYDSLPDAQRSLQFQQLLTPIIEKTLDQKINWQIREHVLVQEDWTSCGAYLIENIASNFLGSDEQIPANNFSIRQYHLALLMEQHPEIYASQFEVACEKTQLKLK